jgi:uncharacterized protein (DUF433 family)
MDAWNERITFDPGQRGRPCIRGMWRVIDVLDLLASGLTQEEVLNELPDLWKILKLPLNMRAANLATQ